MFPAKLVFPLMLMLQFLHPSGDYKPNKKTAVRIINSTKLVIPLHFISWKKTPNDAVTPQRQSQFTPKMKANAVLRLLSSLVWVDQYNECNRRTSFMEFMACPAHSKALLPTLSPSKLLRQAAMATAMLLLLRANTWRVLPSFPFLIYGTDVSWDLVFVSEKMPIKQWCNV